MTEDLDDGRKIVYWHCPNLFIPQSVKDWFSIYKYHKDFPGASMKGAHDQNPRFLKAYETYTYWLNRIETKVKSIRERQTKQGLVNRSKGFKK